MVPEALVASMLPPKEFGTYLAVGTKKRTRGQAMFIELDPDYRNDFFPLEKLHERLVPHDDGQPKRSVYFGVYRVLEHLPRSVMGNLFLVTPDGRVLERSAEECVPEPRAGLHLYREVCPVHPLIVSTLGPTDFVNFITDPAQPVHLPRICFAELRLGDLARNPEHGDQGDLPYPHFQHLRDCLLELNQQPAKDNKTVDRIEPQTFPYRAIESGFFVGDPEGVTYYRFPTPEELDRDYHDWWRSANV
jgi:hypothetical protein